jgi:phosphoglycolate phosphatase-like HAD superfamily hydrolase
MIFTIFDLDGTIVNSDHRKLTSNDGSINLNHWRENCTREKIFADTLLPLADHWKAVQGIRDNFIIVCTARVMSEADFDFLQSHGLKWEFMISRTEGDSRGDAMMKFCKLYELANSLSLSWRGFASRCEMFDDNLSVIDLLSASGVTVNNATACNARESV